MTKKTILLVAALLSAPAIAHPTGIPYSSRGDCEAAYAEYNKLDRERLSGMGFTPGEAQKTFRDLFACQYDTSAGKWFIVLIGEF